MTTTRRADTIGGRELTHANDAQPQRRKVVRSDVVAEVIDAQRPLERLVALHQGTLPYPPYPPYQPYPP
jgi:hypothetical protein